MSRPFRRYCFGLAERLGMSLKELYKTHSGDEIMEWMAYDLTNSEDFKAECKKEKELEESRNMDMEEKQRLFAAHFAR